MKTAIFFATREGHTRTVAEHLAMALRARSFEVDVVDVARPASPLEISGYGAAIVAASVHAGRHEREMVAFVKRHREALGEIPCAFLSVSLSEAGAEDVTQSEARRAEAASAVRGMIETFFRQTGWHPRRVWPIAGALMYTHYGFFIRFVMKRIARRAGATTDTSRDHVFTDWNVLDHFVADFMRELAREKGFAFQPGMAGTPLAEL